MKEVIKKYKVKSVTESVQYGISEPNISNYFEFNEKGLVSRSGSKYTYSYNEQGHCIQTNIWYSPKHDSSHTSYFYERDTLGNAIKCEKSYPGGTRKIENETQTYMRGDTSITKFIEYHHVSQSISLIRTYSSEKDLLVHQYIYLNQEGLPKDINCYYERYTDGVITEKGELNFEQAMDSLAEQAKVAYEKLPNKAAMEKIALMMYDKTYWPRLIMAGKLPAVYRQTNLIEYTKTGKLKRFTRWEGGEEKETNYHYNSQDQLIKKTGIGRFGNGEEYKLPTTIITWQEGLPVRTDVCYKDDISETTRFYEYTFFE